MQSRLTRRYAAATLAMILAAGTACTSVDLPGEAAEAARTILERSGAERSREADVVLLAARAAVQLHAAGEPGMRERTDRLLARLDEMAKRTEDRAGWGLSFAWDAFADGSENPVDTIYSYTTAAAGLTYLDAYEAFGNDHHLEMAHRAARSLLTDTCCYRDGDHLSIWYSDQPADHRPSHQVHNVNGLGLALLSRLDRRTREPAFVDERSDMMAYLLSAQGAGLDTTPRNGTEVATSNWVYARRSGRPSDLLHETFIVEGLLEAGDPDAREAALRSLDGIWLTHLSGTGRPRPGAYTRGSRGWGPPAALFMLASTPETRERAEALARVLLREVRRGLGSQVEHPRGTLWYSLALARFAARSRG